MAKKIVLGTRGSDLVLRQANLVETVLKSPWGDLRIETKIIKTRGDERQGDFGLVNVRAGCEGLFTGGEIERALVAKAIDLAAHFGFVNLIARLAVTTSIARYMSMPR